MKTVFRLLVFLCLSANLLISPVLGMNKPISMDTSNDQGVKRKIADQSERPTKQARIDNGERGDAKAMNIDSAGTENKELITAAEESLALIQQLTQAGDNNEKFLMVAQTLATKLEALQKSCWEHVALWAKQNNVNLSKDFLQLNNWLTITIPDNHDAYQLIRGTVYGSGTIPAYGTSNGSRVDFAVKNLRLYNDTISKVTLDAKKPHFSEAEIARNSYLQEFDVALHRIERQHKNNRFAIFNALIGLVQYNSPLYTVIEHLKHSSQSFFSVRSNLDFPQKCFDILDEKEAPLLYAEVKDFAQKLGLTKPIHIVLDPEDTLGHAHCINFEEKNPSRHFIIFGTRNDKSATPFTTKKLLGHEMGHTWIHENQDQWDTSLSRWDHEFVADAKAVELTSLPLVIDAFEQELARETILAHNEQCDGSLFNCLGSFQNHTRVEAQWPKELQELVQKDSTFLAKSIFEQQLLLAKYLLQQEEDLIKSEKLQPKDRRYTHPPLVLRIKKVKDDNKKPVAATSTGAPHNFWRLR